MAARGCDDAGPTFLDGRVSCRQRTSTVEIITGCWSGILQAFCPRWILYGRDVGSEGSGFAGFDVEPIHSTCCGTGRDSVIAALVGFRARRVAKSISTGARQGYGMGARAVTSGGGGWPQGHSPHGLCSRRSGASDEGGMVADHSAIMACSLSVRPLHGAAGVLGHFIREAPTFADRHTHHRRGSGISAEAGPLLGGVIAFLGAWILFKTQLDLLEGMVRAITDILWTGSRKVRRWRGGDVRAVYYTVLAVVVGWGMIALKLAPPIALLQLAANVGGFVFVVASLHLLYINTRLLPVELRPPLWRRASLVAMSLFYGFFVSLSLWSVLS